jgi:2'-5' RNA ligase
VAARPAVRRLFFALWPSDAVRARLAQEAQSHAGLGRAIPVRNLHITLVFLGGVQEERVVEVLQAAALSEGVRFRCSSTGSDSGGVELLCKCTDNQVCEGMGL